MDLSLDLAPRNSMDSAPVDPACPTLPLTVDLLVIFEASHRQEDQAPPGPRSPLVQAPMAPVDQMVRHTVAPLGPMDLTSF